MDTYKIIISNNVDPHLAEQWKKLWDTTENSTIFNSYGWFLTSISTSKIEEYTIYSCYLNEELVGILPLFNKRFFGIKIMKPVGCKYSHTPFLIKSNDKTLLQYFFENLFDRYNIYIPKIDANFSKSIKDAFPNSFMYIMSVNPYIDRGIKQNKFTFETEHSSIRKIIKKYSDKLKLEIYGNNIKTDFKITDMFEIEQRSTKKKKGMDIFSKKENRDFFINLTKYCKDYVQIFFLCYDNKPIAYDYIFRDKNIFWGYQCAFLTDYGHLSPGLVITILELDMLENSSLDIYDFGGGISTYKQRFTSNYYILYDLLFSKNNLVMAWWKLITLARRANQIIFPIKNTRDNEFLFKTYK